MSHSGRIVNAMAKRYNHQAFAEAIKQGQARMRQTMTDGKPKQETVSAEPSRQIAQDSIPVQFGSLFGKRKKKYKVNKQTSTIIVVVCIIAVIYWITKISNREDSIEPIEDQQPVINQQDDSGSVTNRIVEEPTEPMEQPGTPSGKPGIRNLQHHYVRFPCGRLHRQRTDDP